MSFQPDMIWQYSKYLERAYKLKGMPDISIYANSKLSLSGRLSQTFIDPKLDITSLLKIDQIYNHLIPMK
jgi:hypothetical protein